MLNVIFGLSIALNLLQFLAMAGMRREVSRALKLAQLMHDRNVQGQARDKSGRFTKKAQAA